MDAFSYLSVLLSIILGLAITQVLQGVRGLLLARGDVRLYAPTLIWAAMILVMATQMWWASFGLASHRDWSFAGFGLILLQMVLLYMLAALVLPDFAVGQRVDLKAHYYREARPFFAIIVAMLAASIAKDVVIDGRPPHGTNLGFHLVFGTMAAAQATVRRPRLHEVLAVAAGLLMGLYIFLLFARLS